MPTDKPKLRDRQVLLSVLGRCAPGGAAILPIASKADPKKRRATYQAVAKVAAIAWGRGQYQVKLQLNTVILTRSPSKAGTARAERIEDRRRRGAEPSEAGEASHHVR